MDLTQLIQIVWRWWWLVIGVPLMVFGVGFWLTSDPPYESSLRATILIPGDTEIPGHAERPELMVMDDVPELVSSQAFAEMVTAVLPPETASSLTVDDVKAALSSDRYSRVLTLRASRDEAREARAIADAASAVLPEAVNRYLVAEGTMPATVKVIDPPADATLANDNRWLILGVETLVASIVGVGIAVLADSVDARRRGQEVRA